MEGDDFDRRNGLFEAINVELRGETAQRSLFVAQFSFSSLLNSWAHNEKARFSSGTRCALINIPLPSCGHRPKKHKAAGTTLGTFITLSQATTLLHGRFAKGRGGWSGAKATAKSNLSILNDLDIFALVVQLGWKSVFKMHSLSFATSSPIGVYYCRSIKLGMIWMDRHRIKNLQENK